MNHFLLQTKGSKCGDIAMRHLLMLLRHDKRYLHVKESVAPHASLNALVRYGNQYGVSLDGYRISDIKRYKTLRFPYVAIQEVQGLPHYIVIKSYSCGHFIIYDGITSPHKVKEEPLISQLKGPVLVVSNLNKKRLRREDYVAINSSRKIWNTTSYVLSILFLLLGLYFIDTQSVFGLPLLFLSMAAFLFILEQSLIFRAMKDFDSKYEHHVSLMESIEELHQFFLLKRWHFNVPIQTVNYLLISSVLSFFLIINDWRQSFFISLILFLAVGYQFLVYPHINRGVTNLGKLEEQLFRNKANVLENMREINRLSYRYGQIFLLVKLVMAFVVVVSTLLLMALNGRVYLNYFLFEAGSLYLIFENLLGLLGTTTRHHEYDQLLYSLFIS